MIVIKLSDNKLSRRVSMMNQAIFDLSSTCGRRCDLSTDKVYTYAPRVKALVQ